MVDTGRMEVVNANEQVVQQGGDMGLLEVDEGAEEFLEVGICDFEDEIELFEVVEVLRDDDVEELDDERRVKAAEDGDLAQNTFAVDEILEDAVNTLDGDDLAVIFVVDSLDDGAIRAGADSLGDLVALRDDPVTVAGRHTDALHLTLVVRLARLSATWWTGGGGLTGERHGSGDGVGRDKLLTGLLLLSHVGSTALVHLVSGGGTVSLGAVRLLRGRLLTDLAVDMLLVRTTLAVTTATGRGSVDTRAGVVVTGGGAGVRLAGSVLLNGGVSTTLGFLGVTVVGTSGSGGGAGNRTAAVLRSSLAIHDVNLDLR